MMRYPPRQLTLHPQSQFLAMVIVVLDCCCISDIVPISGLLAGGTTQAHYNSPPLPWNNNILPGITFSLENVNTRITFPQPTTSSISDITPSTVTTAEHNPEGATIDLFAQPFNFVGDTQAAESDLLPLTKHYVEHRPGDPPASEPTFMEDINSCRNTFPGLSEEESGNTLPWWLLHEEPNNTFLNGSTS
ncbi:hypothetical protein BGX38DRAFT_1145069 [Terfezia claveryi]|nr:hypothetical protein BGX38DRAFT_1145069 [Terfezia claveryi]